METAEKPKQKADDFSRCISHLQQLWKGNKKNEFSRKIQHSFQNVANPYELALVCLKQCNGMISDVAKELKVFMNNSRGKYSQCLSEKSVKEVCQVVIKQKNPKLRKLLVQSFQLENVKYQCLPYLRNLIRQNHFKDVCALATLLNLQKEFTTKELTVPLLCQEKLYLADEFLDSSPLHQREILLFIDDLIGKKPEAVHIAGYYNKNNKSNYSHNKMLSKTAAKLIKKYKWEESLFPNLCRRRSLGALRFLFHKYYSEKGVLVSAFHSLIEDALKETPNLKLDLMNLFCEFGDPNSAVPYVSKLELHIDELPKKVRNAVLFSSSTGEGSHHLPHTSDNQEEFENDGNNQSYSLSLPLENVIYTDTVEGFEKCMQDLSASCVIAVDSEWKPTFGLGQGEQVALLQLATHTHVFLIDVISLAPFLKNTHWTLLGQIFRDPDILKLGYGIRGDFNILSKLHSELQKALADVKNCIDFDKIKVTLLASEPLLFSFSSSGHKGLSDLVCRCFGKPLNKLHQFSNWGTRPLSESQKLYAALDARCLIDIYNYLNEKTEELNLDDWKILENGC